MMPCSDRPLLRSLTCLLIGWIWLAPALAEPPAGSLYDAEVPIQGQTPEQRNLAIESALGVVLGRLFGGEAASSDPRLAEVIKAAPRLARSYRFRWDDVGTGTPRSMLIVQFDEAAVNRSLREKGMAPSAVASPPPQAFPSLRPTSPVVPAAESPPPRPSSSPPTLLLWLASERSGQRDFATQETDPLLISAARASAKQQGTPLLFPLYDLEDRTQLKAADLWAMRTAIIQGASRRYAADRVLVGLVSGSDNAGWTARWMLIGPEGLLSDWNSRGASSTAVVQTGLRGINEQGTGASSAQTPAIAAPTPTPTPTPTLAPALAPAPAPAPAPLTSPASPALTAPATTAGSGLTGRGTDPAGPAGGLLPVQVSGVQRWEDYLRAQKFLTSRPGIGQVQVLGVAGDRVTFGVGPGPTESLSRLLGSGGPLVAEQAPGGAGMLRYRLQP